MEGVGVGLGACRRDSEGGLVWAVAVQEVECREVSVIEAEAILLGLKEARRMGMRSITIESDCLGVVEDLKKKLRVRSELCLIYDDILNISASFDSVLFTYVSRNFNRLAHLVSHAMPWHVGRRFWMSDYPLNFVDVASSDLRGMN
ncbi:uncharacterized protein LOC141639534 [Silene latifolia]|uniref:uncharacterized protein LOC141639534 n=1 Tax=Silene latifolia TaxID=37657 RepID=UPI003D77A60D